MTDSLLAAVSGLQTEVSALREQVEERGEQLRAVQAVLWLRQDIRVQRIQRHRR